jgi:hypothetical protein
VISTDFACRKCTQSARTFDGDLLKLQIQGKTADDQEIRRLLLYPLSYEGVTTKLAEDAESFWAMWSNLREDMTTWAK